MTMSDPIADMLTRIRNGILVRRKHVDVPSSKIKGAIALVLKDEGYLRDIEPMENEGPGATLRLHLKYDPEGTSVISELRRVSKPGCRVYASSEKIPLVRRGLGTTIVSTSKGVMSGRKARAEGIGGEVICSVF